MDFFKRRPRRIIFQKIVKNISEKLNFDPFKIIQTNNSKLIKLQNELSEIELEISDEKYTLVNEKNECLEYRIVKTYKSIAELESHNEVDVEIDSDKIIYGEGTNLVQEGQYAVLEEDPENMKLYKRVKLSNDKLIWVLNHG